MKHIDIVSIDNGNGYIKGSIKINTNVHNIIFPAPAGPVTLSALNVNPDNYLVTIDGDVSTYAVGEEAINQNIKKDLTEVFGQDSFISVLTAIHQILGKTHPDDTKLTIKKLRVGVPIGYVGNAELTASIESRFTAKTFKVAVNGKLKEIAIQTCEVMAQGYGCFISYVSANMASMQGMPMVALIDIGAKTVDALIFKYADRSGRYLPITASIQSYKNRGMLSFYDRLIAVHNLRDSGITAESVEINGYILKNQRVRIDNTPIQDHLKTKAAEIETAKQIITELEKNWGENFSQVSTFLITGGGGETLYEPLKSTILGIKPNSKVILQPSAQFANSDGYLLIP